MSVPGQIVRTLGAKLPAPLLRTLEGPAAVFFHGVTLNLFDPELQSNHHAIEDFYAIALALKSNFDVAPIQALPEVLRTPEFHRKTMFLMSDDGYANTLSVAANMLSSLKLPWTLFASTEHIDRSSRNPVFVARAFARFAPDGCYPLHGLSDPVVLDRDRTGVAKTLVTRFRTLPSPDCRQAVGDMLKVLDSNGVGGILSRYESDNFLDWNGVRALAARGVTIGAHAHFHWPMHKQESLQSLRHQAAVPKARIEAEVGPCHYFAFPFGNRADISAPAWREVRDAGYDYAFTTLSGTLNASRNPWLLPRYGLGGRERNLSSTLSLLSLGNRRLGRWQRGLT